MHYFFYENISSDSFVFSSEDSKHITKSLRLKAGDLIWIIDGKGLRVKALLTNVFKEGCFVEIIERTFDDQSSQKQLHIAVAPTKNQDRMEWLVEKAVEIGVSKISFIFCTRSERKNVDLNRFHRIAIAALKQSKGTWLPELQAISLSQLMSETSAIKADKFIAYCEEKEQSIEMNHIQYYHKDAIFLIGPEGDFTIQEVNVAKMNGFQTISLGEKILRTETAAFFVACCFKVKF